MMTKVLPYSLFSVALATLLCAAVVLRLRVSASDELPEVQLNADNVAPRAIEDLTSKSVPRDYALAWQTMEQALSENRPSLLDGYFTGLAKQELTQRVASQIKSGLRTRYRDSGHRLEAIFYAPAGDAMQLRDRARLDVTVLDGDKVVYQEPETIEYMVLMTPGADRWLVRQIEAIPEEKP